MLNINPKNKRLLPFLSSAVLALAPVPTENDRLATLQVGTDIYSNVVIRSISPTEIFFTHNRGLGNAKLRNLSPDLQSRFRFDPIKAVEIEKKQAQANALFLEKIKTEPPPRAPVVVAVPDEKVNVEMADPAIEYKYYYMDMHEPPPGIHEGMTGNTMSTFKCKVDLTVEPKESIGNSFKFRVMTASLSIELPTTITMQRGASLDLKEHEEGHRKISEHFYALGRKAAEHAGGIVLGKEITIDGTDWESAQSNLLVRAGNAVQSEYWRYTRIPSQLANKFYDDVTDHGRTHTNALQVVQQAIDRYELPIPEEPQRAKESE